MFRLQVQLDLPPRLLDQRAFSGTLALKTYQLLRGNLTRLRDKLKSKSKVHTGEMRDSWEVRGPERVGMSYYATVFNDTIQARVIDQGAKPHFPPTEKLKGWILDVKREGHESDRELGRIAFRIARAISQRGFWSEWNRDLFEVFTRIIDANRAVVLEGLSQANREAAEYWVGR